MYKTIILILVAGLISLLLIAPANAASQVASILSVQGYVLVKSSGGNWITPTLAMGLYPGDRIVVYSGSYAVVAFYRDGHMEYLTYKSGDYFVAEIGSTQSKNVWGDGYITSMVQTGNISVAGTDSISQKVGGATGRDEVPNLIKIPATLSVNPSFKWLPFDQEKEETYTFTISNSFEKVVDTSEINYSEEPLTRGETYTWSVKLNESIRPASKCKIYVLTEEEVENLNKLMNETEEKISLNSEDNTPYKDMGDKLFETGLYPEALDYYVRAKLMKPEETDKELDDMIKTLETYLKQGLKTGDILGE